MTNIIPNGGALTMSSREIADLTRKQHQHVKRDIEKMLAELKEDASSFGRIYIDSMNREQVEYMLDRELTDTLLTGYSAILRRRVIKRWHELEVLLTMPGRAPVQIEKLPGELAILECYSKLLNPAPSCRIAMLQKVGERHGLDVTFLPGYAVDAAPDAAAGSSMPTASLTALLVEHGVKLSASAYNTILSEMGLIESRTRRSSKGGQKSFWVVTAKGQEYGKNLTSAASPRETQPHWYTERFAALHAVVSQRMGRAA